MFNCLKDVEYMFAAGHYKAKFAMEVSVSHTRGKSGYARCYKGTINNKGTSTVKCKAIGRYVRMKLIGGPWRLCEVVIIGRSMNQ